MFLVRYALRYPYAVLAAVLGLAFLGLAVLPRIPADILPDFKKPVIMSFFSYPGLPTVDMEKSVTSRVERALTLAGHRERIESRTMPGATMLKITFEAGANASEAMSDIFNYELSDMFHLPPGIEFPFTLRSEPSNMPVMLGAISGEGLSESELYTIGYYAVRNKMGGLQGVQIPHPFGGKFRQIMVYLDPAKLEAFNLTFTDVVDALEGSNLVLAGGTIKIGDFDYQVHPINTLRAVEDIDNVVVTVRDGRPIFVKDLGETKDDAAIQYNIARVNGNRSVYVPLLREPGENTIQVVDRIREGIAAEIPKMKERGDIPESTQVDLVSDQSIYIRNALRNLQFQVGLGAILVVAVVLFFLRKARPAIAILLMLGLSLLIGILGFFFTGQTINVMTLGGMALAVGTVVDAGIVVVENVMRHRAMGKDATTAADDGAVEVVAPIFAGTMTTLVVFIPAIFLTGMIKFLFVPLSLAAVLTIGASFFIAMTVAPVFCARFLGDGEKGSGAKAGRKEDASVEGATGFYAQKLRRVMRGGVVTVAVIVGVTAGSFLLVPVLGSELFPDVDAGTFEVRIKTVPGTRLENTEALVMRIEDSIKATISEEEIQAIISNIGLPVGKAAGFSTILSSNSGPDTAFIIVNLHSAGRSRSTQSYVRELRAKWRDEFPQEKFLFVTGGIINAALNEGAPTPIDIEIKTGSLETGREAAEIIEAAMRDVPGGVDVQVAQMQDLPQLDIEVDRTKAALYGLSQEDVAKIVLSAYGSSTGYKSMIWVAPDGKDFFLGVQLGDNEADSLDDLRNLPIRIDTTEGPRTIPLSAIAAIRRVNIPGEIAHADISRVFNVYVNVEDSDLGSVVSEVEKRLEKLTLPGGITVSLQGPVMAMREGAAKIGFGLIVAAVLVFLILMAQFQSFVDPLIIMLAVPLALAGAVLMLFVTGTTMNIQSLMGALMLIGVVVNNSILLVEFANAKLREGSQPFEAAFAAAQIRLRPIIMTSLTLIASMLPFAFNLMRGSEAMVPLARAVIGGMLVSTVLTLFLVPTVYSLIKRPFKIGRRDVAEDAKSSDRRRGDRKILHLPLQLRSKRLNSETHLTRMNHPNSSRNIVLILVVAAAVVLATGEERLHAQVPPGQVYPITLETALRLADERNTEIAMHLEARKQAVLAEKAAYLEWLPTIRAGGSYVEQDGALQSTGGAVADVDRDATYAGLGAGAVGSGLPSVGGASAEIDFAKAIFEPLAAKQRKLATRAADEATRARVFLEVAEGYYALVRAHQSVAISRQAKAEAGKLAEVTGDFAETGEGLLADAERAAVEELLMEEAEESARGETALASAELARLLRLDDAIRLEPAGNYVVPLSIVDPKTGDTECIARALTQRPELREHQALVAAACAALKERKFSPLIPKLRAAYSYGDFSGGTNGGASNSGDRHDVGVVLYWQLDGLGFLQRNKTKQRESELRQTKLGEGQMLSDIIAEVRTAQSLLASADRRLNLTKQAVTRARKAHSLNSERIFQNEGLPLESLQAMQALATAERLHLRAATDYNVAQLRLHTAMGSHLPEEVRRVGK